MTNIHYLDPNPSGVHAVLLLHGLGANGASWALQMPALTGAGFRPIAPDTPGFGESPYDRKGWSIRRMAAEMAALLDELQVQSASVVGLSMGGTIAQQLVLDYPQKVDRLVLVSTFASLRPHTLRGWGYFIRRVFLVNTLGLHVQAQMVANHLLPGERFDQVRQIFIQTVLQADVRAYRAAMTALGIFNSTKRLAEIRVPTLVLTGEKDDTAPPRRQRALAEGIPSARQVIIANAGHALPVEQTEFFNHELLDFLRGLVQQQA